MCMGCHSKFPPVVRTRTVINQGQVGFSLDHRGRDLVSRVFVFTRYFVLSTWTNYPQNSYQSFERLPEWLPSDYYWYLGLCVKI